MKAGGIKFVLARDRVSAGYRIVYNFGKAPDGDTPVAGLIDVNGTLYGATESGGACCGTVFSVTTSGKETVLHSFRGGKDGYSPFAGLLDVNGTLYGTTAGGDRGSSGYGTVFALTP